MKGCELGRSTILICLLYLLYLKFYWEVWSRILNALHTDTFHFVQAVWRNSNRCAPLSKANLAAFS